MATRHAKPGEIVALKTWADDQPNARTKAIFKTEEMETIRISLPVGKELQEHSVSGAITVHCIEGKAEFTAMGNVQEITAGQLLYLLPGEPHSVVAVKNTVILLTIIFE